MGELRLRDWHHFLELTDLLDTAAPASSAYAFRGHAKAQWKLEPSLLRHITTLALKENDALALETIALDHFRARAHLHMPPNAFTTTTDTLSWLTEMQHHGAPTRLLDWTHSIYVAAYFAVVEHWDDDGAIWLVHIHSLNAKMAAKFGNKPLPTHDAALREAFLKPGAPPTITFVERKNKSDRMIAQQGGFTLSNNILTDHGRAMQDVLGPDPEPHILAQVIVPADQKPTFLRKLHRMNITASTLFPGLSGLAKSISELVSLGIK